MTLRRFLAASLLGLSLACAPILSRPALADVGTWTQTTNATDYLETILLLTDGTVIAHSGGTYTLWYKLTPDSHGNYADGTWSQIASNTIGRLYGQTAVLRDGRVFYGGGEYLTSPATDHNTCEVYDPVANTWTAGPDSLNNALGDTGSAILPNGELLCSNWTNTNTDIYNPATNSWTNAAPMSTSTGDEESWLSLPDGTILSVYDIGQRYFSSQNIWSATGALPAALVDGDGEIGPPSLLYDGRVFVLGGTNATAFYTPPATVTDPGTWTTGPALPSGYGAPDTPSCVEVNGRVLCVGTPSDYGATNFLEYDPSTNVFTPVPTPVGFSQTSDGVRMLALPTGQVLMTGFSYGAWVYTPASGPQAAWAPTITSIHKNADGSYSLAGTQLNGLTNGAAYGDEANPYTNYPLVYLTDATGAVHYARTYNFSQMNPSKPHYQEFADFTLPANLPSGTYSLYVNASGISSAPFSFSTGSSAPAITSFTPMSGPAGTVITITGTNLNGVTAVRFHNKSATVFSANAAGTMLTVTVPSGAATGTITVTTPGGSVKTATPFTVTTPPTITSFTPTSGPAGTVITITGTNLNGVTAVRFHNKSATVFSANAAGTQLTVTVPSGAATGTITVTTPGGSVKTATPFTVN